MSQEARIHEEATQLADEWGSDHRWSGIERTYTAEDVARLRGSVVEEHTLARIGAERLWQLIRSDEPVRALGAITGARRSRWCAPGSRRSTSRAGRSP